MNVSMVRPTHCTCRQVRNNNNNHTNALFAAAFEHIEPEEEANDEVGGGGVAHVGVASGGGGFGGGHVGDGGEGGSGGEVVGHGSVSCGIVTGGVVGIGVVGIRVVVGGVVGIGVVVGGVVVGGVVGVGVVGVGAIGAIGGGAIGGGAIGGGAIGGVGGGSSTNDYLEDVGNNDDNKAGASNEAGANNKATNNNQEYLATGGGGDLMEDETNSMIVEDGGIDNNNEANDYGNNNNEANKSANNNNDDANDILGGGGGMDGLEVELEQMMEGEAGNPSNRSSSIMISSIRDGVVAPHTLKTNCKEILKFLNWCRENKPNWLQAVALLQLDEIQTRAPNECVHAFKARVQEALKVILRNAREEPILCIDDITAEGFMEYTMSHCNVLNGCYLSKSAYGNLRAALFDVFWLHNRLGFPDAFHLELGNLYRGFFRQLTQQKPTPPAPDQPNGNPGNGAPMVVPHPQREKEGKAPMSVELYRHVCRWCVDWGTLNGIFAHTFTILSWNLACHANNTAKIHLKDIEWASTFDAYEIFFAHTKTDQTGEEAKYS